MGLPITQIRQFLVQKVKKRFRKFRNDSISLDTSYIHMGAQTEGSPKSTNNNGPDQLLDGDSRSEITTLFGAAGSKPLLSHFSLLRRWPGTLLIWLVPFFRPEKILRSDQFCRCDFSEVSWPNVSIIYFDLGNSINMCADGTNLSQFFHFYQ